MYEHLAVPNHFGKTKIGNLDFTDTARADSRGELAFILLLFIARLLWFGILARNEWTRVEKDILGFDIT